MSPIMSVTNEIEAICHYIDGEEWKTAILASIKNEAVIFDRSSSSLNRNESEHDGISHHQRQYYAAETADTDILRRYRQRHDGAFRRAVISIS